MENTDTGNSKKSKKKRQAESEAFPSTNPKAETIRGRNYTTSIAVAASTASDPELIACTAGALCRAAVAGEIDEVVIYDDGHGASGLELAVALQYLETPPYLRKALCPMSPKALASLKPFCGLLRPPHHLGQADWRPYREGVVLKSSGSGEKGGGGGVGHSFLDVGLDRMAFVAAHLPVHARVTVSLGEAPVAQFVPEYSETMVIGEVVSAITPRIKLGTYWGFTVRHEKGLGRVLKGCPFKGGYDLTIGTSAKGLARSHSDLVLPRFSHAILVFGGSVGLNDILQAEGNSDDASIKSPEDYFSLVLNVAPQQGGASIRSEDAVLMALGYLRPALLKYGGDV